MYRGSGAITADLSHMQNYSRLFRGLVAVSVLVAMFVADVGIASAVPPPGVGGGIGRRRVVIDDVTRTEGTNGTTAFVFSVTLSNGTSGSVSYTTANGTAVAGSDYQPTSGTLTFGPGQLTRQVTVSVIADAVPEDNETFFLNLFNPVRVKIRDGQGVGTITNDDAFPEITIGSASVTEGEVGDTTFASFPVTMNVASGTTVTVNFSTTGGGTATAGSDYTTVTNQQLTFFPGQTSQAALVSVIGDDLLDEGNETFNVALSGPTNATIGGGGTATGTIIDNDFASPAPVQFSIGPDNAVTEGGQIQFTVSRTGPTTDAVNVQYTTSDGTAVAGADYTAIPAGPAALATIPAGQNSTVITLSTTSDTIDEINENFFVNLSNPSTGQIFDGQAVASIIDDDSTPTVTIADVSVGEGDVGSINAGFVVTLSNASASPITVSYSTEDDTAVAPGDYAAATTTIGFHPGETERSILIAIAGDETDEPNETFFLNLTSAAGAALTSDTQAVGTIIDDDPAASPLISASDVQITEGTGTDVTATITIALSDFADHDVMVNVGTVSQTAQAGSDYDPISPARTITFEPGDTVHVLTLTIFGDALDEPTETFGVDLSSPTGGTLAADADGTVTIFDNDDPATPGVPSVSIADTSVGEGDTTPNVASFLVSLSQAPTSPVSVAYTTASGTAVEGEDFIGGSGTIRFAVGETLRTVQVTVAGDLDEETNETFFVNLTIPTGLAIADPQAVGTIVDNDAPVAPETRDLTIGDVTVSESAGTATVPVTLSAAHTADVTFTLTSVAGTAMAGEDYTHAVQAVTIPTGETTPSAPVTFSVLEDSIDEPDQTFFVNVSALSGARGADPQGAVTITDNDAAPTLSVADVSANESDVSVNEGDTAVFTLTLSAASQQPLSVTFTTNDGTATAPADYTTTAGTADFLPGDTSVQMSVPTVEDADDEADETFTLQLSSANLTIPDSSAQATIVDDDAPVDDGGDDDGGDDDGSDGDDVSGGGQGLRPRAVGYWLVASDGGIFSFGEAVFHGSTGAMTLNKPVVGMAQTATGNGYWLVASDGGIFSFGDAVFHGSTGALTLNRPIVGMVPTATGNGYLLVASDGGIFAFGDAVFSGSTGGAGLNSPIVALEPTPSGNGYWLVASDGGIFAFGDAVFHGSTGGTTLNRPIVGMASTPSGNGYWLVASDGGIFAFGDAVFHGSTGALTLNKPIVGMASTPTGNGYWLVASDGGIFAFGDAEFFGSTGALTLNQPINGMSPVIRFIPV